MKIVVMGSGGVGGFYGGRLAHAGYDVTFVARGAHLAALRENGLVIENQTLGNIHVPRVQVTDDPARAGRADLVLIAVKLWDTEAAALAVKPIVGPETGVLSLQNGVIKDDILRRHLGADNVMGGVAYVGTAIARPGVIRQTGSLQRLLFGEYDGRRSARSERFLEALLKAGIQAELSADIRTTLWEKYVFLVGLSGSTSTIRLPIGTIRAHPRTRAFLLDLMKETVAVGRAHGVHLPHDYAEQRLAFADGVAPDMTSSLHHDLERGNRLEVEWLSGGVVRAGARHGVPTPTHAFITQALSVDAQGKPREGA